MWPSQQSFKSTTLWKLTNLKEGFDYSLYKLYIPPFTTMQVCILQWNARMFHTWYTRYSKPITQSKLWATLGCMIFQHYVSLLSLPLTFRNATKSEDINFLKKILILGRSWITYSTPIVMSRVTSIRTNNIQEMIFW